MKTAGEVLSSLFDERFVKKAQGYSNLFDSWTDITAKNGIAAVAAHSKIKDLNKGILTIEMDHPGWKQILQTKQSKLLNDFRIRFPGLDITGISLMLGKAESANETPAKKETETTMETQTKPERIPEQNVKASESQSIDYDSIKNDVLREKLIKLGQTIEEREKR